MGATGSVGSELVTLLDPSGEKVRAATREPAAGRQGSVSAAEFVEFDFERPLTFAPALNSVDRVFLIARPGDEHPDGVASPLIDEMKRQGVRHVVNLSAMGVETRDDISLRRVELYLEDSGLASGTCAQTRRTPEDRPLRGDATGLPRGVSRSPLLKPVARQRDATGLPGGVSRSLLSANRFQYQ